MKLKITPAQLSALKTAFRAAAALAVFSLLQSLKVPVEFSGIVGTFTPVILKLIDPTFKDYGVGSEK